MNRAKVPSCTGAKGAAKISGADECLNTQTAPDRNGQTLTEGAHRVTAIPHSTPTPFSPEYGEIVRVRFVDVGPSKMCWTSDTIPLTEDAIYREIKKRRALGSTCIDFYMNDDGISGSICVGMFRHVGSFDVLPSHAKAVNS